MSKNAYLTEQHIFFDDTPSVFYGFLVSHSGMYESLEDFDTKAKRDNVVSKVEELFPLVSQPVLVAALIYFKVRGNTEYFGPEDYAQAIEPYSSEDIDIEFWEGLIDGEQNTGPAASGDSRQGTAG